MQVFNPGDTPLVIDDEGHTLAGGDVADIDDNDRVRGLVDAGHLREIDQPAPKPADPKAKADPKES